MSNRSGPATYLEKLSDVLSCANPSEALDDDELRALVNADKLNAYNPVIQKCIAKVFSRHIDTRSLLGQLEHKERRMTLPRVATMYGNSYAVDVILNYGALNPAELVDEESECDGLSLLPAALLEHRADCTEIAIQALSVGARPNTRWTWRLHRDDLMGELRRMSESSEGYVQEEGRPLEVPVNHTMAYWLEYQHKCGFTTDMMTGPTSHISVQKLMKLEYRGPPGQRIAKAMFREKIYEFKTRPAPGPDERRRNPLVIVFCGPPGYGKSEFAKTFGKLFGFQENKNMKTINCGASGSTAMAMWGADAGHVDSHGDTPLGEFCRDNNGKEAVLILDEFDKMPEGVYKSFLPVFEDGVTSMLGGNRGTADVSKFMILVITNYAEKELIEYCTKGDGKHITSKDRAFADPQPEDKEALNDICNKAFNSKNMDAMASRMMGQFIPFVPFSEKEAAVWVDIELRRMLEPFRRPCVEDLTSKCRNAIGGVEVVTLGGLREWYAKGFVASRLAVAQGMRYIQGLIQNELRGKITTLKLNNPKTFSKVYIYVSTPANCSTTYTPESQHVKVTLEAPEAGAPIFTAE